MPIYAILRSIPNKLGGVVALVMSIAILYLLPLFLLPELRSRRFNPMMQVLFWLLCASFVVLMWIGRKPVEAPYELIGQEFTVIYFSIYFLMYFVQKVWSFFLVGS